MNAPHSGADRPQRHPPTPEQRLAIEFEAPYVLVSASAGTGKTKTLIERVAYAVKQGIPVQELLIITFTQKAAEELRDRLYALFDRDTELRPQRLLLPQTQIATIDGFCAHLLRENAVALEIDPAYRILSNPEDELALAEILDRLFHQWYRGGEQPAAGAHPGAPSRGSPEHSEFLRLVELCRYREGQERLKQEVVKLLLRARIHPDPDAFLDQLEAAHADATPPYLRAMAETLWHSWHTGLAAYRKLVADGEDLVGAKRIAKHAALLDLLERAPLPADAAQLAAELPAAIAALRAHLERNGVLASDPEWKPKFPALPSKTKAELGALNVLAKRLLGYDAGDSRGHPLRWIPWDSADWLAQTQARFHATSQSARTLLALVRHTRGEYERYKREEGYLDFADLELRAHALLHRPDAAALRRRFAMVCVDEVQDINPLQAEIISALEPAHGRFLVGDIKQSIYEFRLADPRIFRDLLAGARRVRPGSEERRATTPTHLQLARNFRTRRPVLAFVNTVFDALFAPEMIGAEYRDEALTFGGRFGLPPEQQKIEERSAPGYEATHGEWPPGDDRRPGWAPAEVHLLPRPKARGATAEEKIAAEARALAQRIRALRAAEFPVYDEEHKAWRPLRLSDVAILLRSPGPTGAPFARELQRQGLAVVFGVQPFFEREEIRDALNLVRVIDNAHDDISLAGLLRLPAFDFDDADLARLRLAWPESRSLIAALRAAATGAGDPWSGPAAKVAGEAAVDGELAGRAGAFLSQLTAWRRRAQRDDLASALAGACEEAGLLQAAASREAGIERIGNVQHFLALVRTYCRDQGHSLPRFVRLLTALAESRGGPAPVSAAGAAGDAIQVFSYHKAKGLEFPIVCLPLLGRSFNLEELGATILAGEEWIGLDHFDPQTYVKTPTLARRQLAAARLRARLDEELRLLYVACTRAREKLIVSGFVKEDLDELHAELRLWDTPAPIRDEAFYQTRQAIEWILGALYARGRWNEPGAWGTVHEPVSGLRIEQHAPPSEAEEEEDHPAAAVPLLTPPVTDPLAGAPHVEEALAHAALPAAARRVAEPYAHPATTRWRGKYWATEVKRLADRDLVDAERAAGTELAPFAADWDPAAEGRWLHAVLEAIAFDDEHTGASDAGAAALARATAESLARQGRVAADWVQPNNLEPIVAFLRSPLADQMRRHRATLEREASFTLRLQPAALAPIWPAAQELAPEEWILVQGQIDALWQPDPGSYVLLDFKSDRVTPGDALTARALHYRPQMQLYREALVRIWGAREVRTQLYFLRPAQCVMLD